MPVSANTYCVSIALILIVVLSGLVGCHPGKVPSSPLTPVSDSVETEIPPTPTATLKPTVTLAPTMTPSIPALKPTVTLVPTSTLLPTLTPTPIPTPKVITYTVQAGDTLSGIAKVYGVTVEAIVAANDLESDTIYIGQELVIPIEATQPSPTATAASSTKSNSP